MKTNNINRVPSKQWKKWSEQARTVFNRVYDFAIDSQWAMSHPKSYVQKDEHWKTTAWNMAWIAADAVDDSIPTKITTVAA